jgi:MYXO-CTERM domain-containing protein
VVRKTGELPTDHTDGKVVWSSTDIALGASITVDVPRGFGAGYFAVYATDGTDWLSWTREGWNAAPVGGSSATATGGCGCDTGGNSGGWALVAAMILGARRRR